MPAGGCAGVLIVIVGTVVSGGWGTNPGPPLFEVPTLPFLSAANRVTSVGRNVVFPVHRVGSPVALGWVRSTRV
jgi:hypothetical protein